MLSVAASHANDVLDEVWPVERRVVGGVGGSLSVLFTVSLSACGPPFAVVAVPRILFAPAARVAWTVAVCHWSHVPVLGNATFAATLVPFTVKSIGRLTVVPLEYRRTRSTAPGPLTVHST